MKNQKGITLIALVITIIVLLILSVISIAMFTGSNGIITKATESKTVSSQVEAKEKVQLEIVASYKNDGSLDIDKLGGNLEKNLNATEIEKTETNIEFNYSGYHFSVTDKSAITITIAE